MFKKHTASCTVRRYCLLILDGHSSHATAGFDKFCTERDIIPLYLLPYLSHLLQPLDVSCFSPLKRLYGQKTEEMMQNGIHSINKEDFLYIYPTVHQHTLSLSNIQSGFAATGLVPLSPERVLSNNQSFNGPGKTPANICQLDQQKKRIQHLRSHQTVSPSTLEQAVDKVIKSAEITMQNTILLQQEVNQLCVANQHLKRKRHQRYFLATGGSLTGAEGQQKAQEHEEQLQES
ncbi:hypothetical protein VTN96DRAFT_6506 [Rasamsonia emersonii]